MMYLSSVPGAVESNKSNIYLDLRIHDDLTMQGCSALHQRLICE